MSHTTTQARELSVVEYEDGWNVEDYVTLDHVAGPFKTRAEAEKRLVIISGREVCAYPDCGCPFDAPPNWCAQGLPQP